MTYSVRVCQCESLRRCAASGLKKPSHVLGCHAQAQLERACLDCFPALEDTLTRA